VQGAQLAGFHQYANISFKTGVKNLYNSLKFLFGWNMDDKVDLHIGPTFNVAVARNEIAPYTFYSRTNNSYNQTNVQMWVGLQGSISF